MPSISSDQVLGKAAIVGGSIGCLLLISYIANKFLKNRRARSTSSRRLPALAMKREPESSAANRIDSPVKSHKIDEEMCEDLGPYFDQENGVDSSRLDSERLNFYKQTRFDFGNSNNRICDRYSK